MHNRKGTHEMSTTHRKRWVAIGAAFGAGVAAVVVSALAAFASSGAAASQAKPVNTSPPTISGTPQEGQTLHGDRGNWNNNPTDYNWYWFRCGQNGGSCNQVGSADGQHDYLLASDDVGKTIRLRIRAKNGDGTTDADVGADGRDREGADAAAAAARQRLPARREPGPGGEHHGAGEPDHRRVHARSGYRRTQHDRLDAQGARHLVLRRPGAGRAGLRDGDAVQPVRTIPAEQPTGADGNATLTFQRLSGYPVSNHQELIAMFLRARKPGENVLNGITGYRLVSVPVDLNR